MKMSGLNGSGEMSLGNLKVEIAEANIATIFAKDIVNEVLQKALDIATQVQESKLMWSSIKENNGCHNLINKYVKESDFCHINPKRSCEPAGNIIPVEMETEKVNDVVSIPCKELPGTGGVGDQPPTLGGDEMHVSNEPPVQEITTAPVEKKSRVADLVKSSKQVLSAYILDEKTKRIRDKLEEEQEQFLQVIELDCVDTAKMAFKAYKQDPTEIPLPSDDAEAEEEFLQIAPNEAMDTIDLNKDVKKEDDVPDEKPEVKCGKGDERSSGSNAEVVQPPDDTQKVDAVYTNNIHSAPSESCSRVSETTEKKKKWNFGARILQFLKKPKQKARSTQTVSRK